MEYILFILSSTWLVNNSYIPVWLCCNWTNDCNSPAPPPTSMLPLAGLASCTALLIHCCLITFTSQHTLALQLTHMHTIVFAKMLIFYLHIIYCFHKYVIFFEFWQNNWGFTLIFLACVFLNGYFIYLLTQHNAHLTLAVALKCSMFTLTGWGNYLSILINNHDYYHWFSLDFVNH